MNVVILVGKIKEKVNFKFIYNKENKKSNHISILNAKFLFAKNNIVKIYGYNEIADKLYKIDKEKNILIFGSIRSKMKIEILEIEYLD